MSRKPLDPQSFKRLVEAEKDFESGKLSRRDFNKLLAATAAAAGVSLAEMSPAFAWVATRMRKRAGSSPSGGTLSCKSLRFITGNSPLLSRTPASAGNQKTWTFSAWFKPGNMASNSTQTLWGTGYATGTGADMSLGYCWSSNKLNVYINSTYVLFTNAEFRDPSAWYHIVLLIDTTRTVPDLRNRLFVNGAEITSFSHRTNLSYNTDYPVNSAIQHSIGAVNTPNYYLDGMLSEICFIDGQALLPSAFAEPDATTGQWSPKQYAGTFGTTGFYLPFKSNSAVNGGGTASGSYPNVSGVSGLGADHSGNNNHFTGAGLTVNDRLYDSPVNSYATLNPAWHHESYVHSYADGNLKYYSTNGVSAYGAFATQIMQTKTYYEATIPDGVYSAYPHIGAAFSHVSGSATGSSCGTDTTVGGFGFVCNSSKLWVEGTAVYNPGTALNAGDVVGVAYDPATGKIWISVNGTWLNGGNPAAGSSPLGTVTLSPQSLVPSGLSYNSCNIVFNFGQGGQSGLTYDSASDGAFKYTPPSGFKALCTANSPAPAVVRPSQYFKAVAYSGTGGIQRIGAIVPPSAGYQIARSLRFQTANSGYLSRTLAGSGNRQTWTWSGWLKRANISQGMIFSAGDFGGGTSPFTYFCLNSSGSLYFFNYNGSDYTGGLGVTYATFNDPSAWYHVVLNYDSTNATAIDRIRIYVNGVRQTIDFTSYPFTTPQSGALSVAWNNNAFTQGIGQYQNWVGAPYFDGSMADVYFIDGQALPPGSFGQTDSASGDWVPKAYASTYGTNGFHLDFSDDSNTTATTMGKDTSGNGNNWTPSGFATTDALRDTPTKNFATMNPLVVRGSGSVGFANGNLKLTGGSSPLASTFQTLAPASEKYYFEVTVATSSNRVGLLSTFDVGSSSYLTSGEWDGDKSSDCVMYYGSGSCTSGGATVFTASTFTANDVVGFAYDADAGKVWISLNGVWQNSGSPSAGTGFIATLPASRPFYAVQRHYLSGTGEIYNFGQGGQSGLTYDSASGGAFKYTPPTGFKALCAANLPSLSSGEFQSTPDLVWIKGRSGSTDQALYDSVRGVTLDLASNSADAETTQANGLTALTKTGFTVSNLAKVNTSGSTYVAWMWKKGATPGFDVVTYTGDGTNRQIAHGLGAVPAMIIVKPRSLAYSWVAYHKGMSASPQNGALFLEATSAYSARTTWDNTSPTSSVFTVGNNGDANTNGAPHVAYLWAEVSGFSKFGSYTGNGSADGPFVFCGFRPALVCFKKTSATGAWVIVDSLRDVSNGTDLTVTANTGSAEQTGDGGNWGLDLLASGFKIRGINSDFNTSGGTYIFMAFAEAPLKHANAR